MKKLSILCLAVSLLVTTGCNNEELSNGTGGLYTLTGIVEENSAETRAGFDLDNNGSFFWNTGDAIAVGTSVLAKYTTNCEEKSTSATFTGNAQASGYAVYPYERARSISGNELTYKFESEYTYETVDTDFFNGMSVDMPMWAKVEGNTLSFKHLGGIFAFKFPNLKAGENQTFTLTTTSKISGTFTADLSGDEPIFETSTENVQDEEKKVTINFSLANDADAVFYVPAPVGTYEVKVEVKNGDDSYSQDWKNLTVNRRDICYTTLSSHSLQGSEAEVVTSASDVKSAMEENTNVVLSSIESTNASSTVSIELPKKTDDADVAHSLSIGSIDTNTQTIEIKESTDNEGNSISELTISVPTTEDAKKLVIDMPNTTVSILVNGMNSLTLDEVVASTAESTLIVSKGVNITTLEVKQGNVRIEEGGKVSTINRSTANNDEVTYIIYEGEKPEITLGENQPITLMSAGEYEFQKAIDSNATLYQIRDVATLKLFRNAVNGGKTFAGCTIELMTTIDLNNEEWTPIGTKLDGVEYPFSGTFDGNGKSIKNLKVTGTFTNDAAGNRKGLFGLIKSATIKNLTVENANITGNLHIGVVVGEPTNSTLSGITVKGLVQVTGNSYVSAVVGKAYATLTDITVEASEGSYVKANSGTYRTYVGGIIGWSGEGIRSYTNLTSNIDVECSTSNAGGISGLAHYGNSFINCSSSGNVTITGTSKESFTDEQNAQFSERIGGIASQWNNGEGDVTFTDCSYTGQLTTYMEEIDLSDNSIVGSRYEANGTGSLYIDNVAHVANASALESALNSANSIILTSDITVTSTLYVNSTVTLNLGGHTLTNQVDNESTDVIIVNENGNLTINGEGNVAAVTGNDGYAIISKGTLTINGGTYSSGLDTNNDGNCVIYARDNGKVYINGGTFLTSEEDKTKYLINQRDDDRDTTEIVVKGGKFQNFNPANNNAEGPETSFVAEGYTSQAETIDGATWYSVIESSNSLE